MLDAYEKRLDQFKAINTRIIAASVDPLEKTEEVAEKLSFTVAWGVKRALADQLGAFWDENRNFMHATEFIIDKTGLLYATTYSSSPVGRIDPDEALTAVKFYIERSKG